LGSIHTELIAWWSREESSTHQLVLLPRDHGKSAMIAYRVAWEITRNPAIRVLYISSTNNLASKQLKFIKDILTSPIYRFYWPEMVNEDIGMREKWTESEFSVDHPLRRAELIRDPTVFTGGLTTSLTGLHCDIAVLDDVVVKENAYTEDGRQKVKQQYSLLSSIEGAEAREWAVGTRYHPKDLYNDLMEMEVDRYDKWGDLEGSNPLYECFERQVETRGDGTGEFLWPRQQRYDGKWFGFDAAVLAKKRAQYLDRIQYKAQYYNNPNSAEDATIQRDCFQYYDPKHLLRVDGRWYFKGKRINVFAAIDFAFSLSRKSDFTAIVVVGVDAYSNFYVLEIDRFKTDKISDYFQHILKLHQKWDFRKLRAETTVAQSVIVNDLKLNYIRPHGLALTVDEHSPSRAQGAKEERIDAILQPRYANHQIWHYMGGNCQVLEDELSVTNPAHDDVKDALAACIDICIGPSMASGANNNFNRMNQRPNRVSPGVPGGRFGGIM
jgi:hypothetical protein